MRCAAILLAWAQGAAPPASAPSPVQALAAVEGPKGAVELGLPFDVVVVRRYPAGTTPPWSDAALAPLDALPRGVETRREGSETVERRRFEARAFAPGELEVPSLGLRVEVRSALPEPAGPVEPPPGPYELPFPWRRAFAIALAAALLAAAVLGFLAWRRRRPAPAVPPPPPIPPHDRALARLAALRALPLPDEAAIQRFHVEVTSLVRDYLEERFGVRAPEMTTEEFLSSPSARGALGEAHRALLAGFLGECDLVKFARRASDPADRARFCGAAERLVQETRA